MIRNLTLTLLLAALCCAPAHAVTFDWVTVGDPNNADDTHGDGYGGVDYTYRISKHEVTNAQYAEFLNAVDPTGANSLSLYNSNMSSDARGGINLNGGAANGSKYEIKSGRDNNPVVYTSFFDAMRFVNWLENGQGSGDTESGVYTIGSGTDETRNPNATFFIPSEDEWYKAAYYDPSGVYYDYPTGTDTEPYSDNPASLNTPDDTNVANFFKNDSTANGYNDGYAVTGSTTFVASQNYLTDVGAYSSATSPYGTFDQGGNVWEWNEAVISSSFRGLRGGSFNGYSLIGDANDLRAGVRGADDPAGVYYDVGFRVATVPEPSTVLLGALAAVGLLMRRRA
jgi:formylglycine-generating enzyme required for sulfatase activity